MKPSRVMYVFCVISIFSFIACGIESQESTFKYRLQALDELSAKASGELKTVVIQEKARLEERYSKLPAEEAQRGEGLGLLNMESRDFITQITKKLDELAGGEGVPGR